MLTFLQELLRKGHTPPTQKNYLLHHRTESFSVMTGLTFGRNDLDVKFLKGARRLNTPTRTVLMWDLSFEGPSFEPLPSADLQVMTLNRFALGLSIRQTIG